MNPEIFELINSFESNSKKTKDRFREFLSHVYTTFDKKISLCKTDRMMNKYKKMRISILRYIVAHEKEVISILSK